MPGNPLTQEQNVGKPPGQQNLDQSEVSAVKSGPSDPPTALEPEIAWEEEATQEIAWEEEEEATQEEATQIPATQEEGETPIGFDLEEPTGHYDSQNAAELDPAAALDAEELSKGLKRSLDPNEQVGDEEPDTQDLPEYKKAVAESLATKEREEQFFKKLKITISDESSASRKD
jgi:hypothetical protein